MADGMIHIPWITDITAPHADMSPVSVSSVYLYLRDPRIELPDLWQLARAGEVSGVHEHVAVWDGVLDVGGQGVGVRHADESQLKNI